jgi:hypothetical protein
MCGGVRFNYDPTYESDLADVYSSSQLAQFRESGLVESLFWQSRPVLPVILDGQIQIIDWGNRQKELRLPQTGWVRQESLDAGKWNYLQPQPVTIPVLAGVEQKVWFSIDHGIQGIMVRQAGSIRVYMLTIPPTPAFTELTGHNRMPALINQPQVTPIAPVIRQVGFDTQLFL